MKESFSKEQRTEKTDERRSNSEHKKIEEQLEKAQKKQKYMLKYLGRAKIGGCNLHEKIR